jgi:WD40 repeat protein
LLTSTARTVVASVVGPGGVSATVAALAEGASGGVALLKKAALTAALAVGVAVAGAGILARPVPGEGQQGPKPAPPAPKEQARPGNDLHGDALPPGAAARLGTVRFAEWNTSSAAVALSADGKLLAGVGSEGIIHVWDARAGKRLHSFGPPNALREMPGQIDPGKDWPYPMWQAFAAFSPDGKTLLTGSDHGPVRLWDVATGKELRKMEGSEGGVMALAVAPDFKSVAAVDKTSSSNHPFQWPTTQVSLWEVSTGKAIRRWSGDAEAVWALAWSPDGKTLASGGADKCIHLWDPQTGKETGKFAGPANTVLGVAFAPDGKTLASADRDRTVRLWDLAAKKQTQSWRVPEPPQSAGAGTWPATLGAVFFTSDGKRLLTRDILRDCPVDVWEVPSGKPLRQFLVNSQLSPCCAVSSDGATLATVTPGGLFDLGTGKPLFESPGLPVTELQFLPDGRTLVTNERDLWDTATGKKLRGLDVRQPATVSPDGKHFAEWGHEAISVRDLATGKEVRKLPTLPAGSCWPLVFSPDGRTLAAFQQAGGTQRNEAVRLWDVASGKEQRPISLSSCPRHVSRVVLSADGRLVAGLGQAVGGPGAPRDGKDQGPDGPCYLWDRTSGRLLHTLDLGPIPSTGYFARKIAFSPDGRVLASFGDNGCQLWEVLTGQRLRWPTERMTGAAAFSPDGRLLAWSDHEPEKGQYVIHLTDLFTGKDRLRLPGHPQPVAAVAFSPDGKRLASGSQDRTALVWDLSGLPGAEELKAVPLTARELQALWADLEGNDAAKAQKAVVAMMQAPQEAIAFLERQRAGWAKKVEQDGARVVRLLAEVDHDDFEVREKATRGLRDAGPSALPWIVKHLRVAEMSLDARRRLEKVRDTLEAGADGPAAPRGLVRATEVLERVATAEARKVLERLAEGVGPASDQAQAALRRLGK